MVHRAPDSRLLTNLISTEKEYAKHLAAVFPLSHAALASLSAYAAASPSSHPASPAHAIAAIVDVLAGADDALQRYTHAIDTWREQLVALKGLEDDLVSSLRDRDILVTRLIKASKSTRDTNRSSRLVAPLTTLGSASFSSLPSTNSTAFSSTGSSPASTNAKLAQAQAELQACEEHLASKERELDARRITLARDGLGARCRALIDCGWVWGEMGRQGLKTLQGLHADSGDHAAPKQSLTVPPRLSANPTTYASDNSSLTPSQSASQTAARSVETSHEGPSSKEHEHVKPETKPETTSKLRVRSARPSEDGDLTITLPPAYAIPELTLPTSVRAQPRPLENGDSTTSASTGTAPEPRRKRTKRSRRPPSQHITEASDEGSDVPPSAPASRIANASASSRAVAPHTPFPTTRAPETLDTSSDDDPTRPIQVVDNDPFAVIRRSMIGPVAGSSLLATTTPVARASAPDVRVSLYDSSPVRVALPGSVSGHEHAMGMEAGMSLGSPPGSGPARRQRRTSLAFFGSLRGLFRKPKERERVAVEWDEGHSSPTPWSQRARTNGWVTRTDARIKTRRGGGDSDEEATPTTKGTRSGTQTTTVVRAPSGTRLRKGRPGGTSTRVPSPRAGAGVDGWTTDTPARTGAGLAMRASIDTGGLGLGRSRTRQGTNKQKKTSVADLRGVDHGHTDGELEEEHCSLQRVSNKVQGKAPEASVLSKAIVEVEEEKTLAAHAGASTNAIADTKAGVEPNGGVDAHLKRAATTTMSRKASSDAALAHRRSASLSVADAHVTIVSASSSGSSQGSAQGMSWRKPPPQIEPASEKVSPPRSPSPPPAKSQSQPVQVQTQPPSRAPESQPRQNANARRHLANGHAKHARDQSFSLMSIVADVTRQGLSPHQGQGQEGQGAIDRARSLDVPRAPGSVLSDGEREKGCEEGVNGRGHVRAMSGDGLGWGPVVQGQGQGQSQGQGQRATKLPLKSALRNASRTPSPRPGPASVVVPASEAKEVKQEREKEKEGDRGRVASPPWRDSASISSYETGRESWNGETTPSPLASPLPLPLSSPSASPSSAQVRSQSQPPVSRTQTPVSRVRSGTPSRTPSPPPSTPPFTIPPPPVEPPPVRAIANPNAGFSPNASGNLNPNYNADATDPPSSRTSTETPPANGQRRKSVRMSLQPTFSPTPPDEEGDHAPWDGSRREGEGEGEGGRERRRGRERKGKGKGKEGERGDVWDDSSEEDEAYSRARRLLSLVGRAKG